MFVEKLIDGGYHIWSEDKTGQTISEVYYFYTLKESISKFRKKYPAKVRRFFGVTKIFY